MMITALNESPKDTRVAISPNAVKHYQKLGFEVALETKAGLAAGFTDEDYSAQGASIIAKPQDLLSKTQVLLALNPPAIASLKKLPSNALLICPIDNERDRELIDFCCKQSISLFSMNAIPRISRAQSMDSLSSQANLAGYCAVLEGVHHYHRVIPMMMTAAGMIQPAKILVLGAGVAGLQAIATAKRLGAVVYAFDVRLAAKEQVESLGAEFIAVEGSENNETSGGYAKETSEEYKALQAALIHKYALMADIVISSALIPGKKAPRLIHKETVNQMKPGSVIVDMASAQGGNCELSQDNAVIKHAEVTLLGYGNLAAHVPATASELYSGNLLSLIKLLASSPGNIVFKPEDEIIQKALLCHEGKMLPFQHAEETVHAYGK